MRIVNADNSLHFEKSVIALGNFDGVHIAHQKLIGECVRIAHENNLISAVYTFSKHPQEVLGRKVELLTVNSEKEAVFDALGVDVLIYQEPKQDFLSILPEEFIESLINKFNAEFIVVGEHYTFGKNAAGNSELLREVAEQNGVKTYILPLVENDNHIVSSSRIRHLISSGDVETANNLLGREFRLDGVVEHGKHIATQFGFPTMNFPLNKSKLPPKFGVYACKVVLNGNEYKGIANVGVKPTVCGTAPMAEVNLFDVNGDFYGQHISVKLLKFIRPEEKFKDIDLLEKQINSDVCKVKEYFLYDV